MNWRSGSDSLTEDKSSANMRAPQKNPLTVTPCPDEERCIRRSLTKVLYST